MKSTAIFGVAAAASLAAASGAQVYLAGVVSYGADAAGNTITEPGEYDNIVGTGNFEVSVNGQPRGTTFALPLGTTAFGFNGVGGQYNALSMYFSDVGDPFGRPFDSDPDLVVFGGGSGTPQFPVLGALVQTNGQFSGANPYSGATSFVINDLNVTVTSYIFNGGSGAFEITVGPVPSPAAGGLLALGGLAAVRRRR